MDRSDSLLLLTCGEVFLSLNLLSRLAPAVGASGGGRASQFLYGSLLACHALRPRQVSGNLTLSVSSVLGSDDATASPPACFSVVSRLDCFSGVRLPLAACESPCVRFQTVVRLSVPSAGACACPSVRQHSGLGGWLGLSTQVFRSGSPFMFSCCRSCSVLEGLSPSEPPDFHWRTAS